MQPTNRAFRFLAYGRSFAVDIHNDTVLLLGATQGGWERVPEFITFSATDADITTAGGAVKFTDLILEAVNFVLRLLGGKPADSDIPVSAGLQGAVLSDLRANARAWQKMDGTVELQRKL